MSTPVRLLKGPFTVDHYHRLAEMGILGEDDRVELIDGEIVTMTPIGPRHASCVRRLVAMLSPLVGSSAIVDVQNPLRLGEHGEPQPDVVLLKPRPDYYRQSHPGPGDVLLVVEVADTSAEHDRVVKVPAYARAGIAEFWLIDLSGGLVEVYRRPAGGEYAEHVALGAGGRLTLPGPGGHEVAADDLLA